MRDHEFEFLRALVYERSRISLDANKRELVAARLTKRLRATGLEGVGDYCRLLRSPEGEEEQARLIDAISTNHTFFFRESAHFALVRTQVIPELAAQLMSGRGGQFNAWSAACSSGEEAYSLAMTLDQSLEGSGCAWRVDATDISHRILDAAQRAIYRAAVVVPHAPGWAMRYFEQGFGPQQGNYRVRPELRSGVNFRQLNLLAAVPPFNHPLHLIFCRNVMIYFDRPTQEELIHKLTQLLVPGGYLMVGHSEGLTGISHRLQLVQPSVYRRPGVA